MINTKGILDTTTKGLMVGNGNLGAIVFGHPFLCIALDKIDLWDERKKFEYKSPLFNYKSLVELLNNDYQKAYSIFDNCYLHPYPTKINAGLIVTDIQTSSNDDGIINFEEGIVKYFALGNSLSCYSDMNADVVVIQGESDFSFDIKLPEYFYKSTKEKGLGYNSPFIEKNGDFTIVKQDLYKNNYFSIVVLKKKNILLVTIDKNVSIEKQKEMLTKYYLSLEASFIKHKNRVKKYLKTSIIKTPDSKLNNLYNLGKYSFLSNSSKNFPMTLQGCWTNYNDLLPPWKNDLHNDLNMESTYEGYLKAGNFKEGKVLVNYLYKNRNKFKQNAKKLFGIDGYYIPGDMANDGFPLGGWPQYAMSLSCGIWLLSTLDNYYLYTKDEKVLKKVVYPFFVESERIVRSTLVNKDNHLCLPFSSSPEYFEDDEKSIHLGETNFDVTMLTYLYSSLVKYSMLLNQDYSQYESILSKINKLYQSDDGAIKVAKCQDFDMSHRHFSHLLGFKNIHLYDPYLNQETIKKSFDKIESFGTDKWVGFSYTEAAGFKALLNDGDGAYRYLKIFASNFVHDNGFHMNNDYKENKYSKMDCYVFTLEANISFVTALNDMMIKSFDNKVTIFPAIPERFKLKGVSFKKLRIQGGHSVSAKTKKDAFSFVIKMNGEDTLLIENNFMSNPTLIVDGALKHFNSNIGDFIEVTSKKNILFKK